MIVKYELHTLKNGMQVLLIPSDSTYSVTVSAQIRSGSALENEQNQGITHFVEHMSLKATEKWKTSQEFNTITEFNGASFNGSTSSEILNYYINIPHNKLEFGIDFMEQILYHSTFNKNHVESERTIILDEISKLLDTVGYKNNRFVMDSVSAQNSGYSRDIAGTEKTVKSFSKDDLYNYYHHAHDPSKILLTIVGNFSKSKALKLARKHFSKHKSIIQVEPYPADGTKQNIVTTQKSNKTDLILTTLLFEGLAGNTMNTKEIIIWGILMKILAGPMTSRLMKRLREKEGLLYHIGAQNIIYETFGGISIYFDTPPTLFEKTYGIVLEELDKFATKGTNKKELNHFKELYINRNLVTYDNIYSYSQLIKKPIFYGDEVLTLEEQNQTIKDFTVKKANALIRKYFTLETMNSLAFGNIQKDTTNIMQNHWKKYK